MIATLLMERELAKLGFQREFAALWLMHTKGRTPVRKRKEFA